MLTTPQCCLSEVVAASLRILIRCAAWPPTRWREDGGSFPPTVAVVGLCTNANWTGSVILVNAVWTICDRIPGPDRWHDAETAEDHRMVGVTPRLASAFHRQGRGGRSLPRCGLLRVSRVTLYSARRSVRGRRKRRRQSPTEAVHAAQL